MNKPVVGQMVPVTLSTEKGKIPNSNFKLKSDSELQISVPKHVHSLSLPLAVRCAIP